MVSALAATDDGPSHHDGGPRRIVERLDRKRLAAEINEEPTTRSKQKPVVNIIGRQDPLQSATERDGLTLRATGSGDHQRLHHQQPEDARRPPSDFSCGQYFPVLPRIANVSCRRQASPVRQGDCFGFVFSPIEWVLVLAVGE